MGKITAATPSDRSIGLAAIKILLSILTGTMTTTVTADYGYNSLNHHVHHDHLPVGGNNGGGGENGFSEDPPAGPRWSYHEEETGPQNWGKLFEVCDGSYQSPIDIDDSQADYWGAAPFELTGYDGVPQAMYVENNGYTATIFPTYPTPPTMKGGDLDGEYKLLQVHWHWGSASTRGSEHLINHKTFPMEIHFVHFSARFGSIEEALASNEPDALAVLGFMYEIAERDNGQLDSLIARLQELEDTGDETVDFPTNSLFPLTTLIDAADAPLEQFNQVYPEFYRYEGSLTTPPCNEQVIWTVFTRTIKISERQMATFRSLRDRNGLNLSDNYRPVLPLGDRVLKKYSTIANGESGPATNAIDSNHILHDYNNILVDHPNSNSYHDHNGNGHAAPLNNGGNHAGSHAPTHVYGPPPPPHALNGGGGDPPPPPPPSSVHAPPPNGNGNGNGNGKRNGNGNGNGNGHATPPSSQNDDHPHHSHSPPPPSYGPPPPPQEQLLPLQELLLPLAEISQPPSNSYGPPPPPPPQAHPPHTNSHANHRQDRAKKVAQGPKSVKPKSNNGRDREAKCVSGGPRQIPLTPTQQNGRRQNRGRNFRRGGGGGRQRRGRGRSSNNIPRPAAVAARNLNRRRNNGSV